MKKTHRFSLVLTPIEKSALSRLAEIEGGLSQAALLRKLLRESALRHHIVLETNQQKGDQNDNA